jgi:hypothetical protein
LELFFFVAIYGSFAIFKLAEPHFFCVLGMITRTRKQQQTLIDAWLTNSGGIKKTDSNSPAHKLKGQKSSKSDTDDQEYKPANKKKYQKMRKRVDPNELEQFTSEQISKKGPVTFELPSFLFKSTNRILLPQSDTKSLQLDESRHFPENIEDGEDRDESKLPLELMPLEIEIVPQSKISLVSQIYHLLSHVV